MERKPEQGREEAAVVERLRGLNRGVPLPPFLVASTRTGVHETD